MIAQIVLRIEKNKSIRLVRQFTGVCKPIVKVGQKVSPADVIAHCEVSAGKRMIRIAYSLGVPGRDVKKYLTRKVGDNIYEGEIIARKRSLFGMGKVEVKSPVDGLISEIDERGDLLVQFLPKPIRLYAAGGGEVEKVTDDKIIINTKGNSVNGFVSLGKMREGLITIIANPKDFIMPTFIKPEHQGQILVGGSLLERGALEKAVTLGVRGIITGGMHKRDFESLGGPSDDVGITVMLTEGFGISPMGKDIWDFLKESEGKAGFISGEENSLAIPATSSEQATSQGIAREWRNLKVGDKVKFFREESSSLLGEVKELGGEQILNSGILTEVALVESLEGEKLLLPAANLEIVEN